MANFRKYTKFNQNILSGDYIAIVGSRDFPNLGLVEEYVNSLRNLDDKAITIVSGGARGVDRVAEFQAKRLKIPTLILKPNWTVNGVFNRSAGYERNSSIVKASNMMVAFWYLRSNGTYDSIIKAEKKGIPILIFDLEKNGKLEIYTKNME